MKQVGDLKLCPCGRLTANPWGWCCRCGLNWRVPMSESRLSPEAAKEPR
jgi:hypothetical protein